MNGAVCGHAIADFAYYSALAPNYQKRALNSRHQEQIFTIFCQNGHFLGELCQTSVDVKLRYSTPERLRLLPNLQSPSSAGASLSHNSTCGFGIAGAKNFGSLFSSTRAVKRRFGGGARRTAWTISQPFALDCKSSDEFRFANQSRGFRRRSRDFA